MALHLTHNWLWDFWLAQEGPDYHVFYLQATRSLGKEELRHWHVSIGHAVSQDLRSWTVLPDVLHPSAAGRGAFDDYTTWTGSVLRHAGLWHLFYTGTTRAEKGLVQRIGLATSQDLIHWEKHPENPILVIDPRWYELLDLDVWHDQAWRDPYVFQHPETGEFHTLITARCKTGPPKGRGVIGHACSTDLIHWEVLPPLTEPGEFGHLEVPQWIEIEGRYYLLFCAPAAAFSEARLERGLAPATGTFYLRSDTALGPFTYVDQPLCGDARGSLYAGKLIQAPGGDWVFMAWENVAPDGTFIGALSDPLPIIVELDGNLTLNSVDENLGS